MLCEVYVEIKFYNTRDRVSLNQNTINIKIFFN